MKKRIDREKLFSNYIKREKKKRKVFIFALIAVIAIIVLIAFGFSFKYYFSSILSDNVGSTQINADEVMLEPPMSCTTVCFATGFVR